MMNVTKVLVTRYGGAGDMIMMEPVLEALYYKFTPAEIHLRTHFHYTDLHEFHPLIQNIVPGVLTANPQEMAKGILSDEKKPQGFDYFYNTTGSVEMNRGIHGIDSFAFACSAIPFRRTPVMYLDPSVPVESRDIVIHTPKKTDKSPRNNDFRTFGASAVTKFLDQQGIKYDSIVDIGSEPETEDALQNFARTIAGAKLFIGPDSAGAHIASALSVPRIVAAYTDYFPAGIRAYPNTTIPVRDNNIDGLLSAVETAYTSLHKPLPDPLVSLLVKSQKYAYGRTCGPQDKANQSGYDLIQRLQITFEENWRHEVFDLMERLSPRGILYLYEKHPRFGGTEDPIMIAKYLIQTCGMEIVEYSATADEYGHFFVEARKLDRS